MSKTFLSIASGPGIALATAGRFGREGYRVVLAARNIARLQADAGRQRAGRLRHGSAILRPTPAPGPASVGPVVLVTAHNGKRLPSVV
jgi:NAD(P)-dependent dehydrogenase (short-subunit alcohol dehydrogenase family)